jgi:glycosyltransferase involved in cell wall biosynthesis
VSKFHALLPVRDEGDIIGQCLAHLLQWADAIYVFDTGSVDDTWEIVQQVGLKDRRVVPLGRKPVYFSEPRLRGWMFHRAREHMRGGDWFLRVDADEFHHIPPPEFVRSRMRPHETIAHHQYYEFALTQSEVDDWGAGRESLADRKRPIEERRQWYTISVYSEPRLCRYRESMKWPPSVSFPFNAGFVARERLPIRHYPHRDPVQLARRCRLRAIMMADGKNRANWARPELHHWAEAKWRKFVVPDYAEGLRHWAPGSPLPEVHRTNHLAPPPKRLAQRLAHTLLLPLLDRTRPGWPEGAGPQPISPDVAAALDQELRV